MIKKITFLYFSLIAGGFLAQNAPPKEEHIYKLPSSIKYVDTDNDEFISQEEALVIFDQYLSNKARDLKADLIDDVECTVMDLIAYMEGVSCDDIKRTVAAKRFIELYYANKFHPTDETPFGLQLGFGESNNEGTLEEGPDTAYVSEPLYRIEKSQTAGFDKYFSVGAQLTAVYQNPFKYKNQAGENSQAIEWKKETLVLVTLPVNFKPWKGAIINLSPEFAGGNGVGNGAGLAGYPNALYGYPQATPYLLRAQYKQEFLFTRNQNSSLKTAELLVGKFILQEAFDGNAYSGDPKRDFLNFNHTMFSAWDAATTAYGFTYGTAIRLNFNTSQINFALATVDKQGGGPTADWNVKQAQSYNLQFVQKIKLLRKTGTIRLLGFCNRAFSGSYSNFVTDTTDNSSYFPDSLKSYKAKYGFGVDMDLALSDNLGFFARYSWNDGKTESMGYTQADQSINAGLTYSLGKYKRSNDLLGISASINDLSKGHRNFLAKGGTGFMIGDGSLNYKSEMVAEIFFRTNIVKGVDITFNYQYIANAAYNKDRGNMHFLGWRLNVEF